MPPTPQSKNNQVKISCKRVVKSHFSWVPMEGRRGNDIGIFKGRRLGKASQERDEVDLEAAEEAKSSPPPDPPLHPTTPHRSRDSMSAQVVHLETNDMMVLPPTGARRWIPLQATSPEAYELVSLYQISLTSSLLNATCYKVSLCGIGPKTTQ